ncbi:MAG: MGMT family protein [Myxococcota bacterium]
MSGARAGAQQGWSPVYRVVRRVPEGRVATYGQVAAIAGMPGAARQVGWALNALDEADDVPWHRVINARGEVSGRGEREIEGSSRARLGPKASCSMHEVASISVGSAGAHGRARPRPAMAGRGEG